jgi:hypothetical protein
MPVLLTDKGSTRPTPTTIARPTINPYLARKGTETVISRWPLPVASRIEGNYIEGMFAIGEVCQKFLASCEI